MVEKSKPHNQLMDNNNNININNDDNNNNNYYYNSKRSSIDPILSPENVSESFQKKTSLTEAEIVSSD